MKKRSLIILYFYIGLLLLIGNNVSVSATSLDTNIISNSDGDSLANWNQDVIGGASWSIQDSKNAYITRSPFDDTGGGDEFIDFFPDITTTGQVGQDITLTGLDTQIDSNQLILEVSAYMHTYTIQNSTTLGVQFYTGGGASIDGGPYEISHIANSIWLQKTMAVNVPATTRRIRVLLKGSTYSNGYIEFDGISAVLKTNPVILSGVSPTLLKAGTAVYGTSNLSGTLYLVPKAVYGLKTALDAVAPVGKKTVACTGGVAASIDTTGLGEGTYQVYAVDSSGNVSAPSADITVDNTAPNAPNKPAAAAGPDINGAEKTAGVAVDVSLGTSGAVIDDIVELLIGGVSFGTPVTHTLTGGEIAAGHCSLTIPATAGGGWETDGAKSITAKITDAAGNAGAASAVLVLNIDLATPALVCAARTDNTHLTVTLSENSTNLTKTNDGGFTVCETGAPGTIYAVSRIDQGVDASHVVLTVDDLAVSGKEGVTVKYTAGGNGNIQDTFGNAMATNGTGVNVTSWDIQAPAVTISTTASEPTSVSPIPVQITFSEAVTGFVVDDIMVGNGTKSSFSGSGTTYTVDVTPAEGIVTVDVFSGVAQDVAGNGNTAATRLSRTYQIPKTMTISADVPVLTESNLDGRRISVTLTGITFADNTPDFTLNNSPAGLTIAIANINSNQCVLNLSFNGSMNMNFNNFSLTVAGSELTNGDTAGLTSNELTITDDLYSTKHYTNSGGSGNDGTYLRSFQTAGNFRGDLMTTWNHELLTLGKGTSGINSDLWFYYPTLTGVDGLIINSNTLIDRAELVLKVKSINGDKFAVRRIKAYTIPAASGLGQPCFGTADGLRSGLTFQYRDSRLGRKIPWKTGAANIQEAVTTVDWNDTFEYLPYAFEENGELLIKLDVTTAVRAWVAHPDQNQGWYITSEGEGGPGDNIALYGISAANIGDRPYLRIIYADTGTDLTSPAKVEINIPSLKMQDRQITLNWTNSSSDLAGIRIVRKYGVTPSGPDDGSLIADRTAATAAIESFADTNGLVNGRTYYYAFFAYDSQRNYSPKSYIALIPEAWPSSLTAPTNFNATVSTTTADLTWADNPANKTSNFVIKRSDDGGTTWNTVATLPGNWNTYQDRGLQPNTSYRYRLWAVNPYTMDSQGNPNNYSSQVDSNPNPVTTLNGPAAPDDLSWSIVSAGEVQLCWTIPSTPVSYRVEILDASGKLLRSETPAAGELGTYNTKFQYSVMRLTANIDYRFRVVAINSYGENAVETEVIKTAPDPKPLFF